MTIELSCGWLDHLKRGFLRLCPVPGSPHATLHPTIRGPIVCNPYRSFTGQSEPRLCRPLGAGLFEPRKRSGPGVCGEAGERERLGSGFGRSVDPAAESRSRGWPQEMEDSLLEEQEFDNAAVPGLAGIGCVSPVE